MMQLNDLFLKLTLLKNAIVSYRALDLENGIAGGSHIRCFPTQAIPNLTKHDRGGLAVIDESNEGKNNVGWRKT